jgi:hypothetical protein
LVELSAFSSIELGLLVAPPAPFCMAYEGPLKLSSCTTLIGGFYTIGMLPWLLFIVPPW